MITLYKYLNYKFKNLLFIFLQPNKVILKKYILVQCKYKDKQIYYLISYYAYVKVKVKFNIIYYDAKNNWKFEIEKKSRK